MHTEKCWFEKGNFDHFGMCFGCFRAHFLTWGSLKQPQHVKKVKNDADQKDAHWKMLV